MKAIGSCGFPYPRYFPALQGEIMIEEGKFQCIFVIQLLSLTFVNAIFIRKWL